ncbi:MAG TPA: site-2 protease family protein [Planctomycetota bacterium]|nr:site-2 protease family protein [Planctomycetota bacterium]
MDPASLAGLLIILLLSLSWHEAAHAWVADKLGDPTARSMGRVTLNPLKHLDPFLSVLLPLLMYWTTGYAFGGGKPVPINVNNFRNRARDFMLVALAGPGSNILLAVGFSAAFLACALTGLLPAVVIHNPYGPDNIVPPTMLQDSQDGFLGNLLVMGVFLNLALALFNMVPLPPLDGSRVVGWLLPRALQRYWYALDRIGILLVIVLFYVLGGSKMLLHAVVYAYAFLATHVDSLVWMRFST